MYVINWRKVTIFSVVGEEELCPTIHFSVHIKLQHMLY